MIEHIAKIAVINLDKAVAVQILVEKLEDPISSSKLGIPFLAHNIHRGGLIAVNDDCFLWLLTFALI